MFSSKKIFGEEKIFHQTKIYGVGRSCCPLVAEAVEFGLRQQFNSSSTSIVQWAIILFFLERSVGLIKVSRTEDKLMA